MLIQNATPFLKIKQLTLLKYSNQNSICSPSETSYGEKSLWRFEDFLRKWNSTSQSIINATMPNFQQLFIVWWHSKFQNQCKLICIIYARISHNSKVMNDMSTGNVIQGKQLCTVMVMSVKITMIMMILLWFEIILLFPLWLLILLCTFRGRVVTGCIYVFV